MGLSLLLDNLGRLYSGNSPNLHSYGEGYEKGHAQQDGEGEEQVVGGSISDNESFACVDVEEQDVGQGESDGSRYPQQEDVEATEPQGNVVCFSSIYLADGHFLAAVGGVHGDSRIDT